MFRKFTNGEKSKRSPGQYLFSILCMVPECDGMVKCEKEIPSKEELWLHVCARTTEAIRRRIQNSKESIAKLSKYYNLNPKAIVKWRKRSFTKDADMGPKHPRSTVLTLEEEAIIVAFRKHTLLPLDDCLYALQSTISHLTRSSLHCCLQRHNISRLPDVDGEAKTKKKFKQYPIGYFHIDIAEVRTEEDKLYLFVAIDRTSKLLSCITVL